MLVVSSSWLYQGREWDRGAEEAGEGGVELPGERLRAQCGLSNLHTLPGLVPTMEAQLD